MRFDSTKWIGWRTAVGAAGFVLITGWAMLAGLGDVRDTIAIMVVALVAALLGLLVSPIRQYSVGFLAVLLLSLILGGSSNPWRVLFTSTMKSLARGPLENREVRARRAEWLAIRRGRPINPRAAPDLAYQVSRCRSRFFGDSVPDRATFLAAPQCAADRYWSLDAPSNPRVLYAPDDNGWRWTYDRLPGQTVMGGANFVIAVRPDPVLEIAGPVVELDGDGRLLIRDTDQGSRRAFITPVPTLRRVRECVLAAQARPDPGRRSLAIDRSPMPRDCDGWRIMPRGTGQSGADPSYQVDIYPETDSSWTSRFVVRYRVLGPGRFELRSSMGWRAYLLDADGAFHVTTAGREAEPTDAAPPACELDRRVPCEPAR